MTAFPFGETVVLHARAVTGQDADGNDVYGDTATSINNVPVWPRNSSELVQGQDTLITGLSALLPVGTNPAAIDYVTRTKNGKKYEVDGEPGEYESPFTGTNPGVLVNLTRIG